jgi:UDP-glucose 4-epimerase
MITLLYAMAGHGVDRFVFSSSAAVSAHRPSLSPGFVSVDTHFWS